MSSNTKIIEVPDLSLNYCTVDEHCNALLRIKKLPFWWYQGISRIFGNFSLPFKDNNNNWWYQVKPGFCWPVETYKTFDPKGVTLPLNKTFIGYQYLTTDSNTKNIMIINTIEDLSKYGPDTLKKDRRKGVRKGFERCSLAILKDINEEIIEGCMRAWSDLTTRTGWKQPVSRDFFSETWRMILDCPGYSIIIAREAQKGEIAGFYVTKIIGDTTCGDTIAVRDDMLHTHANDALRYSFISNAAKIPVIKKACCSIKSNDQGLEDFKTSLGYKATSFPACTKIHWGFRHYLKYFRKDYYNRLLGIYE